MDLYFLGKNKIKNIVRPNLWVTTLSSCTHVFGLTILIYVTHEQLKPCSLPAK